MRREVQEDIDYSWQKKAACKGIPTKEFYPGRGDGVSDTIKEKCDNCPVKVACLAHALKYEAYGYWAGTSEKQRRALRAAMGISLIKPETVFWYSVSDAKKRAEENRPRIRGRGRKVKEVEND